MMRTVIFAAMAFALSGLADAGLNDASAASRVWLSAAKGVDSNPCSLQAPCRTFLAALNKVDTGGEIDFLDPGGYGFADITKAVSIVNDGIGEAGSQGSGGVSAAIFVRAGATEDVVIRGLTIEGARTTPNGVDFISGRTLTIQNCVIRNFTQFGVLAENAAAGKLEIIGSTIMDNYRGVNIATTGNGYIYAAIDKSTISNNVLNVAVDGVNNSGIGDDATKVTVSNSQIAFGTEGVVTTARPQPTNVVLSNNVISHHTGSGVHAERNGAQAVITLANNTITHNAIGINNNGTIYTFDDNHVYQNNTDAIGASLIFEGTR